MAGSLGPKDLSNNSKVSSKSILPSDSHKSPLSWLAGQSSYFHCLGEEIDAIYQRRSPLYQSHILGGLRLLTQRQGLRTLPGSCSPLGCPAVTFYGGEYGKTGSGIIASSERKEEGPISPGAKEEKRPEVPALIWPVTRALFI